MELLKRYCAIGAAGFVGAVLRYTIAVMFGGLGWRFPIGTLVINVSGSLFLGWFLTFAGGRHISEMMRLAIGTGFVGAYTTFSTFAFESTSLADQGAGLEAILYLLGSLVLGVLAVKLGMILAG
jgi:CrcB protein